MEYDKDKNRQAGEAAILRAVSEAARRYGVKTGNVVVRETKYDDYGKEWYVAVEVNGRLTVASVNLISGVVEFSDI